MSTSTVTLHFTEAAVREDLSAVVRAGRHLWLASDETTHLERLTRKDDDTFTAHASFPLAPYLSLPAGAEEEIDIEGLDYVAQGEHRSLWLVGSHSVKRKLPKEAEDASYEQVAKRLATIGGAGNRFLLARLTLKEDAEGNDIPAHPAAQLHGHDTGNVLTEALRNDPHVGPFMTIPSKDNGFDIEGLAVAGERIFLGLRGPVLRGWAVILEIALEPATDPRFLQLQEVGPGTWYHKHFLYLDGLGVRELCLMKSDLLILAGPTMELDGPVRIYRWKDALTSTTEQFAYQPEMVREVPFGKAGDHAEGITLLQKNDEAAPPKVLVIYDSPTKKRLKGVTGVQADVFAV
jgi:hypothetical protein